jgi:hypothetical protein
MARRKSKVALDKPRTGKPPLSRSRLALGEKIVTLEDIVRIQHAVAVDLLDGTITTAHANVILRTTSGVMRAAEFQARYGDPAQRQSVKLIKQAP